MERLLTVVSVLAVLTPALWTGAYLLHPEAKVGVILVDACPEVLANYTAEAFDAYRQYFDALVLPQRFNASWVRAMDGEYFTSDFFISGGVDMLKERYGVDILIFVTDHPLRDLSGNGLMQTGRADLATGAAMVSIPCEDASAADPIAVGCVALHETFHLLGYRHSASGDVMGYGSQPTPLLSRYSELQLPLRLISYKLGFGSSLTVSSLVNGALFATVLLPWSVGLELLVFYSFWKRGGARKVSCAIMWVNIGLTFFLISAMSAHMSVLLVPPAIMTFTHSVDHAYHAMKGKSWVGMRSITAIFKVFRMR